MGLDIKVPIGLMFTILGLLLTIFGLATASNAEMYQRSLDININLWTGAGHAGYGHGDAGHLKVETCQRRVG